MSQTRIQLKQVVLENLTGQGVSTNYYSSDDLNDLFTDALNEVCAKTRCLVNKVTLNWQSGLNYYDPIALGVADYLGTIGVFNHNSNLWLRDDVTIRDFNRIRRDWELWVGEPQFWASHSQRYFAVCPTLNPGVGQFDLWYYQMAPAITDDITQIPIATDMGILISDYMTTDELEGAQEISKAQFYLDRYKFKLEQYRERCHKLAAHQLLLRV